MTFSLALMTDRVRDLLDEPGWDDALTTTISSTATTTFVVPDTTLYDVGAVIEEQGNGEQVYVTALASATQLTVKRGYNGTTKQSSIPSGTLLRREPRYSIKRINNALTFITAQLWPYAYRTVSTDITPVAGTSWYDLSAADMALVSVNQVDASGLQLISYGQKGSRLPIAFSTNVPTGLCASGVGIYFPRGFGGTSTDITVTTARQIDATLSSTDLAYITDGLMSECVATGVAARLALSKEIGRDTFDDTGMGDASVPPGSRTRVGRDYWAQFVYLRGLLHEQLRRSAPLMGAFHGGALIGSGSLGPAW